MKSRNFKLIKVTEIENIFYNSSMILKLELQLSKITTEQDLFGILVA